MNIVPLQSRLSSAGGLSRILSITIVLFATAKQASVAAPEKAVTADHAAAMAKGLDLFKKQVRPLLVQRCYKCHGGDTVESKLDLSDRDKLLHGGESGPALVAGNADASLLYQLVRHAKEPKMPYGRRKLADNEISVIARWINLGAPYDTPLTPLKKTEPSWTDRVVAAEARQFWSFQPLRRLEPPVVKDEAWSRTPIDRFILVKLEAAGIAPNPPIDRRRLIRRAYFDVLGLPPTPEEVKAFVSDQAPDAYDHLIERLLRSPHYGERWGRHWLDLARFAESHGFEHDTDRPSAYQYRDFVIQALNDDLPFDTFVAWQLAGDEIAPANNEALKATGFLAAGVHSTQITKNEVEKHRYDELDDMLGTVGTSMLGLTIACARCHDHKFDPIPQADYYRLLATFTTTVRSEVDLNLDPTGYQLAKASFDREHAQYTAALLRYEAEQLPARIVEWEQLEFALQCRGMPKQIRQILRIGSAWRSPEQAAIVLQWYRTIDAGWITLAQREQQHLRQAPRPRLAKALISSEGLPAVRLHTQGGDYLEATHFLRRGDPTQKERVAPQGFLQVVMPGPNAEKHWQTPPPAGWRTSYHRRALAQWITDADQGAGRLLARVIVNRLWQHHMGRGIVATPSDFGNRGERPTHPELLDWLATELIANDWHLKPIHKLIMMSNVYQVGSQVDEDKARLDSGNRLFWRRPTHRLEGEVIRDALLAVGGILDPKLYGPGTLDPASMRRSIYFTVKRSKLVPMLQVFDAPEALGGVAQRPTTTVAPQALWLLNNPQVRHYARGLARRVAPVTDSRSLPESVRAAYEIALNRPPGPDELADGVSFIDQQTNTYTAEGKTSGRELALTDLCQALFCSNEFVYVE